MKRVIGRVIEIMVRKQNLTHAQTKKGAVCSRNYREWILCQSECRKIKYRCQNNYIYLEKKTAAKIRKKTGMGGRPLTAPINKE